MTDIDRFKSKKVVIPPNRRFETRVNQKPRSNLFRVYIASAHRPPRMISSRRLQVGKVFTAEVQTEENTDRLYWSPVFYDPFPNPKNQKTFEAFGRTWKVYRSIAPKNRVPVWVFTSEYTADLPEARPGSTDALPLPDDLYKIILEN